MEIGGEAHRAATHSLVCGIFSLKQKETELTGGSLETVPTTMSAGRSQRCGIRDAGSSGGLTARWIEAKRVA